jgi:hypothetical protein
MGDHSSKPKRPRDLDQLARAIVDHPTAEPTMTPEQPPRPLPNQSLLAAVAKVDLIQRDMNPTRLSPTQEYIEEARSGAMYGYSGDADTDPDRR